MMTVLVVEQRCENWRVYVFRGSGGVEPPTVNLTLMLPNLSINHFCSVMLVS